MRRRWNCTIRWARKSTRGFEMETQVLMDIDWSMPVKMFRELPTLFY